MKDKTMSSSTNTLPQLGQRSEQNVSGDADIDRLDAAAAAADTYIALRAVCHAIRDVSQADIDIVRAALPAPRTAYLARLHAGREVARANLAAAKQTLREAATAWAAIDCEVNFVTPVD